MNIMKNNKLNIIVCGLAAISLSACGDSFLDVSSKTESNTATFYKTENDAYRALVGCYDGWQCTTSNNAVGFYLASEVMSDNCFGATGHTDARDYQAIDRFDITESSSALNIYESEWKNYYAAIYRCNVLLQNEENIAWKSERTRNIYMGECRTIRAMCYFDMTRLWGAIPLLTEPSQDNIPQADPSEIFEVILSDLKYAADNMPADAYPKVNTTGGEAYKAEPNDGHITCYAAKALMARVYLFYTGYYGAEPQAVTKAEVLQGLEDVIASNQYDLVPDFKDLWPAASSVAMEIPEGTDMSQESNKKAFYKWDPEKTTYAGDGNCETILAQKFNYTQDYNGNADGNRWLVMVGIRSINTSPYGQGWGAATVNPRFYRAYDDGDARRSASIINLTAEGVTDVKDFAKKHLSDQREYTGFTIKKYTPLSFADGTTALTGLGSGDFQISQYQDFIVMRYADVLLMAAELGSARAQSYMDMVRGRSGLKPVSATKENILKERMFEFAFEGQRYWDLLRQGIDYAANQLVENEVAVTSGGVPDAISINASNVKATKGLSQIPGNQITLSKGVLKQNDGWK